jgi:hypothetical protein
LNVPNSWNVMWKGQIPDSTKVSSSWMTVLTFVFAAAG